MIKMYRVLYMIRMKMTMMMTTIKGLPLLWLGSVGYGYQSIAYSSNDGLEGIQQKVDWSSVLHVRTYHSSKINALVLIQ